MSRATGLGHIDPQRECILGRRKEIIVSRAVVEIGDKLHLPSSRSRTLAT